MDTEIEKKRLLSKSVEGTVASLPKLNKNKDINFINTDMFGDLRTYQEHKTNKLFENKIED